MSQPNAAINKRQPRVGSFFISILINFSNY